MTFPRPSPWAARDEREGTEAVGAPGSQRPKFLPDFSRAGAEDSLGSGGSLAPGVSLSRRGKFGETLLSMQVPSAPGLHKCQPGSSSGFVYAWSYNRMAPKVYSIPCVYFCCEVELALEFSF